MTRRARQFLFFIVVLAACGGHNPQSLRDPIGEFAPTHQRKISRADFGWQWPFTVGIGTLGCDARAVVFRANGTSYGLNDRARARGFAPVDSIRQTQTSGPRHEPFKRLSQNQRMRVFAESTACVGRAQDQSANDLCKQRVRERFALSEAELAQIEIEGDERIWPPLSPKKMKLDPVVDAGLALCGR